MLPIKTNPIIAKNPTINPNNRFFTLKPTAIVPMVAAIVNAIKNAPNLFCFTAKMEKGKLQSTRLMSINLTQTQFLFAENILSRCEILIVTHSARASRNLQYHLQLPGTLSKILTSGIFCPVYYLFVIILLFTCILLATTHSGDQLAATAGPFHTCT